MLELAGLLNLLASSLNFLVGVWLMYKQSRMLPVGCFCVSGICLLLFTFTLQSQTNNQSNQDNLHLCGSLTSGQGSSLSSGTTITPTHTIHQVSGVTSIATITTPSGIKGGCQIVLMPTGVWATLTSSNIALVSTAVVDKTLTMTWDSTATKWKPSY